MSSIDELVIFTEYLRAKGLTLSLAESCTGGWLSKIITSMPGASEYYAGCAVTYSNEAKERILGVSHDTLVKHGAVSEETAIEMAKGARKAFGTDFAVSITGIAGPGGGSEEKPVGLVYIAATDGTETVTSANRFSGERDDVRSSSVYAAILCLLELAGIGNEL